MLRLDSNPRSPSLPELETPDVFFSCMNPLPSTGDKDQAPMIEWWLGIGQAMRALSYSQGEGGNRIVEGFGYGSTRWVECSGRMVGRRWS